MGGLVRSSSDPDLQSNRAPSVDLEDEEQRATARVRRSRTPGPMRSREADGLLEAQPTPTDDEEEARFAPSRQLSASSVEEKALGVLSEAEALRAAAVRHLSALAGWCSLQLSSAQEQAWSPEERVQALELPSSCPNATGRKPLSLTVLPEAFQGLGLPVATGHPNEEDGVDDERVRECAFKWPLKGRAAKA